MTDCRKPYHDERLKPCPICGGEPWTDSKNGTIYCDCGLRYHMNGECHPEWHRMDWTADEWNRLANVWAENDKLRELVQEAVDAASLNDMRDWRYGKRLAFLREARELGIEDTDD